MIKNYYITICLILIFLLTLNGCEKKQVKIIDMETHENKSEYKLIYENPIDGGVIEKKVSLSSKNIEEQIIYELFKLENIPKDVRSSLNVNKLKVLNVEYVEEEKKVKINFNKALLYYEGEHNDVRYFHTAIYDTLAQFDSVEYVAIFVEGKFVEGLGELVVSGKIYREKEK
ncbi:GerMN domain-containing protein [Paramaledivibacter caminithermalis]|jgi:hypothetical protein|uniref:Sporulation and spore germination n=1 Tax=Paramaledivibacter caminithermalis (strain DSM 15212 / CIP 107654 / DViRD3) TaxID=1121301 RepID=A0A1M6RNP7_PARC5|nr:GerMN domain-containing protein [Paramaledivibacter caminithermalis]SHK34085.1 Sporulation and spore germination [Paramaledivibacter caminithermalis DSM 15212]